MGRIIYTISHVQKGGFQYVLLIILLLITLLSVLIMLINKIRFKNLISTGIIKGTKFSLAHVMTWNSIDSVSSAMKHI